MIVAEEVESGLGGAACACTSLNYSYLISFLYLLIVFMGCLKIRSDGHAIVRLEDFARSQPCIGRVLFSQLALVIIIAYEFFEVERGFELSDLEV